MKNKFTSPSSQRRKPWVAAVLSVPAPGLGHIYCGQLVKGLVLFFASFAFAPVIVNIAHNAASTVMLVAVIISLFLFLAIILYAAVDSALSARRVGDLFQPKEYNRAAIYLLFIVVSMGYPTNLANTIRDHVFQAFKIPSQSMGPSILPGDRIFLNKAVFKTRAPERGDVVVFRNPDDRRLFFLKRIIGLPGETIEMINNVIHIDGQPLTYRPMHPEPRINFETKNKIQLLEEVNGVARYPIMVAGNEMANHPKMKIPHGYCFVMSDNRAPNDPKRKPSRAFPKLGDSRHFGPIPLADVQGRLDYIYWSAAGWSRFGKYMH